MRVRGAVVAAVALLFASLATDVGAQDDLVLDFYDGNGDFNYSSALSSSFLFFEAQRSGKLPANQRVDWRGDSLLNDGFRAPDGDFIDLSGGYHDAGDALKIVHPLTITLAQVGWSMLEFRDEYTQAGQDGWAADFMRWGLDWLMRAHYTKNALVVQVGSSPIDHDFKGPPERIEDDMKRPVYVAREGRPASDIAANAAAALAVGSLVFEDDESYSGKLLKHAKELYSFAVTEKGRASEWLPESEARLYNSTHYEDDMMWAACWLFRATLDSDYYQDCKLFWGLAKEFGQWNMVWNWDNMYWGALVLLQKIEMRDYEQEPDPEYQRQLDRLFDTWMEGDKKVGVQYTSEGFGCIDMWGVNRNTMGTVALAFLWGNNPPDEKRARELRCYGESQTNYVLGQNARTQSYVAGWGDKYPEQPHHRAAACADWSDNQVRCDRRNFELDAPSPHVLHGGMVFGECKNEFGDLRTDYETTEVALDANAPLTIALAALVGDNRCYGEPFVAPRPGREARDHLPKNVDAGDAATQGDGNLVDPSVTAAALAKLAKQIGAKLVLDDGSGTISTGGEVVSTDGEAAVSDGSEDEESSSDNEEETFSSSSRPDFFPSSGSAGTTETGSSEEEEESSDSSSGDSAVTANGKVDSEKAKAADEEAKNIKRLEQALLKLKDPEAAEAPKSILEQLDTMVAPPPPSEGAARKPDASELAGMAEDAAGKAHQQSVEDERKQAEVLREQQDRETAARIDAENRLADAQRRGLPIPPDLAAFAAGAAPPPPEATMISNVPDAGAGAFAEWNNLQNVINGRRRLLRRLLQFW